MKNYPKDSVKLQNVEKLPDGRIKCDFEVTGDEKLDHLAFTYWMKNEANDFIDMTIKFEGKQEMPDYNEDDEIIRAVYTYYFEPDEVEPDVDETAFEETPEDEEDMAEFDGNESLKFNIAKEQVKRYNEGKMPTNWDPNTYLENLVNHEHITSEQKHIIEEAFLINK